MDIISPFHSRKPDAIPEGPAFKKALSKFIERGLYTINAREIGVARRRVVFPSGGKEREVNAVVAEENMEEGEGSSDICGD